MIGVVAVIAVMIFALVDISMSKDSQVRVLNRPVWILLIVVLPGLGAILWFVLGKGKANSAKTAPLGPDDDDDFVRNLGKETVDERIRRLEEELRELDSETDLRKPASEDNPDGTDASDGTPPASPEGPDAR